MHKLLSKIKNKKIFLLGLTLFSLFLFLMTAETSYTLTETGCVDQVSPSVYRFERCRVNSGDSLEINAQECDPYLCRVVTNNIVPTSHIFVPTKSCSEWFEFLSSHPEGISLTACQLQAPPPPTMQSNTQTSITLNPLNNGEYRLDGGAWTTNRTFGGLEPATLYPFTQRRMGTVSHNASPPSDTAWLSTASLKEDQDPPPAPTIETVPGQSGSCFFTMTGDRTVTTHFAAVSPDTVTVNPISNGEYRIDDGSWTTSRTFSGLSPNTTYSLTQRYRETSTHNASPSSAPTLYTTPHF